MKYINTQSDQTLTCTFEKNIDANVANTASKEIKNKLDELIGINNKSNDLKIVFDLSNTDYASSLFLRVVVMTANRISKDNFIITNANQFIRDLFKTSGLEKFIALTKPDGDIQVIEPSMSFSHHSWIKSKEEYLNLYNESINKPNEFWGKMANEHLIWNERFDKVHEWKTPYAKWFTNGKLNACFNCVDKHLYTIPDKVAIIWEGEPDEPNDAPAEVRKITYKQLYEMVGKFANVLKKNGINKGDRIVIYMPMIPETVVAMLACARVGAIHSVIFAGFSAQSIADRVEDCQASMILTTDGSYRRGSILGLKKVVDEALKIKNKDGISQTDTVKKVIIHKHTSNIVNIDISRDIWLHEELENVNSDCDPEIMDSEDNLFILYTSGSTGKPKGIVHSTAGYLLWTKLGHKYVFDIKDDDIYWCSADLGWITGHSYVVYGPLANGSTIFMYEGAPNYPDPGRFWKLIEKHKITIFYTAPTAIRAFIKWGKKWTEKYNLHSLRLLGTAGEPINPQAWLWYYSIIGNERCPIVDTWWQTETGGPMITSLPGAISMKPGSATLPFFGIVPEILDSEKNISSSNVNGSLIIKTRWPGMLRGIWGNPEKYNVTYWKDNPGFYTTGDSARKDDNGYYWIVGREDDVINISGHRIGTAEVESTLLSHETVAEVAAVGRADDLKGSALVVFVTLMPEIKHSNELTDELKQHVAKKLGAVLRPEEVRFVEALPKTRSGKIMRRLLKQVANGTEITGDITTLEDFSVLENLTKN